MTAVSLFTKLNYLLLVWNASAVSEPKTGTPFPENIKVIENTCGIERQLNISWEVRLIL